MIDLSAAGAAAAHDPLLVAWVLFAAGGIAIHFLFRRYPLHRAVARVIFLVILTFVLLRAGIVPFRPLTPTGAPFRDAVHAILKIAWWFWAAWFVVGFLRVFVVTEHRPREGKLIQDLLAGLVYLAAFFAVIAYVFDLPVRGLLATSGAVAIILGLALQSTLSDVFSGIVLNFSRPYRPGDWISIDGSTDGRVIEMNWRATHVLTAKRDLAIVPNSAIAKAKIVNASSPSGIHGMTVSVQLDAATSPASGSELLEHAVLNSRLILATPAPTIVVKSISAAATEFEITFFVEELSQASKAQNELFDLIARHLAVAGAALAASPSPPLWPAAAAVAQTAAKTAAERAIDLVSIFAALTEAERKTIAAKTVRKQHDAGEVLLEPGNVLHTLYVIGSGIVSLTALVSEGEIEFLRLGPGDHFGEMGMLTGRPAEATLKALVPVVTYELAKEDLAPILEARPEVAQELCRALARRQAAGQLIASAVIDRDVPPHRVAAWFSDRLHRLFDLANAA
ncbi:MAG TPA: mechanosensitive ion channel family protein [Stellaceae bacterium]|jgi:small-conductance mechanosensitive channel/CRP-like cAMP-binding protein